MGTRHHVQCLLTCRSRRPISPTCWLSKGGWIHAGGPALLLPPSRLARPFG